MKLKNAIKKYHNILILAGLVVATVLLMSTFRTLSETTSSDAWDGIVAHNFSGGTGTIENPYVISDASEFAYFKKLMESEDASVYANKNYVFIGSFNYGEKELSINNEVPFSGVIEGNGHNITNFALSDSLFNSLDGATIKNLWLSDGVITFEDSNAVLASTMNESNITSLIIEGDITLEKSEEENEEESDVKGDITIAGLTLEDTKSSISNVIININVPEDNKEINYISIADKTSESIFSNILIRDGYKAFSEDKEIDSIYTFLIDENGISIKEEILEKFNNDDVTFSVNGSSFYLTKNVPEEVPTESIPVDEEKKDEPEEKDVNPAKGPTKGPDRSPSITLHATGVENGTVYINDLDSDLNYYTAMDYTYFVSTGTLPDYTRLGIYNENTLVKVYIKYSGTDIHGDYTGYVSNNESYSDFVYYKYYPVSNGYVTIPLIDNPYGRRPNDKVFMGWITDYIGAEVSLDVDIYVRYVKIPVNDVTQTINITMYPVWGTGKVYEMTSSNTVYSTANQFTTNMVPVSTTYQRKDYGNITDFSAYYIQHHINRYENFPAGSYSEYLEVHNGGYYDYCSSRNGCDYYTRAAATYDPDATYYILNAQTGASLLPYTTITEDAFPYGIGGYFKAVTVRNASKEGLYSNTGVIQHGNCSGTCNLYEFIPYLDANGNVNMVDQNNNYYYFTTRDTNILVLRASPSRESNRNPYHRNTVPLTITSYNNGQDYTSDAQFNISNAYVNAQADLRIEHVSIYSTSTGNAGNNSSATSSMASNNIFGNYYNLKIGRGLTGRTETSWNSTTNYLSAAGVYAGNTSGITSANLAKYTTIVESGKYNILGATGAAVSGGTNMYVSGTATWGSDLDRVLNDNTKLDVYYSTAGNWGGNLQGETTNSIAVLQIIKSGFYGSSHASYSCGVYAGGRGSQGSSHYAARSAIVEGGEIYNLIGGPFTATNRTNVNDTYLYVKGGVIDLITGGAGLSTTYGNRIIAVTGGNVRYGVLGGSNGTESTGASNQSGEVFGSTFVYIGGTAHIGGGTGADLYGVEPGGVFGAGNGKRGLDQVGSVNNSNILINGGTIDGNVFGGGNFGATGYALSNGTTSTTIKVLQGTIAGSVYGGGNNNGSGKTSITSSIDIDINGGTISGSVFGGSRNKGRIYGSTDVAINGGTITHSVYGGGEGGYQDDDEYGTYVRDNVVVTVNNGSIGESVYGGSAYGSVNTINETTTTSSSNVAVTINGGVITNSVFGGGKGSSTYTPKVIGNITVTVNNGDIGNVFGGNDQAGSHTKQNEVHLNGGIIGNVYGGGNRSSVTNTHVYLAGSSVTNLYGGSNTLGDVSTTDVNISAGSVQNVYGGNNEGGTCGTTDVDITGTATIGGSVYGGGNQVNTTTTTVTLNSVTGSIPSVYGGGNSASVGTTNVINNGVTVTTIFGGSNSSGTVTTSNITNNSGNVATMYGGNNAGGNTINSKITYVTGTSTSVYGGGNNASGDNSDVKIQGGTITNLFGGGNNAGLNSSKILVTNGSVTTIYGGSNVTGSVSATDITINNTTSAATVYGGGNRASVGSTSVKVNGGTLATVYGGGNLAGATGNTVVDINGGTINSNLYGGGNYGAVNGNSTVTITDATILGSAYAGGNGSTATVRGNTIITIDGDTVIGTQNSVPPHYGSVFGGGNQAYTGTDFQNVTSTVNIVGGTIYGNVYGGANTSVIYGSTTVNIGAQALSGTTLDQSDIYIKGHIFGGGEANASGSENYDWDFISVTQGTNIIVDGTGYNNNLTIGGSFYGGGNASSASGDSYLLIKNYGVMGTPKRNVSIQRVKYVTIDHSSILLRGAIDRANDYSTELFSVSRVGLFKIKNNTEVYFETGANLLEQFESLDSSNNYATVVIDEDNHTITSRSVDNRVYMYEGRNLNIAKDQQVSDYGEVKGMTFFGIFNYDNDNNVNTGIYDSSYDPGDILDWAGTFSRGSYVLGKHTTNHDIRVNGFYSNFINEDTAVNEVNYIFPTPTVGQFYMWFVGENVIEYNVNLVASKYSTLGSVEASFLEFSKPNTSFQILSFDSSEIAQGITLNEKSTIPRIANNANDANNKFGLSIESSNNGWLTFGKTNFFTREPSISGTTYYEGENTNIVPTLLFYLYHSKNISVAKDLGTVRISVMAITKINAISSEVRRLVINVNMSTALFQTTEYEGAMTPGDKYELFVSTTTNITTKSKFSAYYGLYSENSNVYRTGYHRVLSSSYIFPVGTKITMIDFVQGVPEYYYHVISQTDYNNAVAEYQLQNECSYALSLFTKMGSKSNNSNYNDATQNALYYDGTSSSEEFIFIVDFGDTTISQNELGNTLMIEMRDANEESIITVLGIQHDQLTYNLYANSDAQITVTPTLSDNPLYIGYSEIIDMVINYRSLIANDMSIIDTQYFDSKLGVQVYLKDSQDHVLSGTDLTGTYFSVDNKAYYPDINGYTHIKLADKVGNTEKWLIFNTENSTLASGSYTFVIETFASPDGIYYSKGNPTVTNIPITIISSVYGLNPIMDDNSVIFSANNDKNLKFNIAYTSLLEHPNIRLAMYRREYDGPYDTDYDLVDLQDYISQALFTTNNQYEYLLISNPSATNSFNLTMEDELLTGTYRLAFRLYDNDTMIGEIIRYIIVK